MACMGMCECTDKPAGEPLHLQSTLVWNMYKSVDHTAFHVNLMANIYL